MDQGVGSAVIPQTIHCTHLLDLDVVYAVEDKAGIVGLELGGSGHFVLYVEEDEKRTRDAPGNTFMPCRQAVAGGYRQER